MKSNMAASVSFPRIIVIPKVYGLQKVKSKEFSYQSQDEQQQKNFSSEIIVNPYDNRGVASKLVTNYSARITIEKQSSLIQIKSKLLHQRSTDLYNSRGGWILNNENIHKSVELKKYFPTGSSKVQPSQPQKQTIAQPIKTMNLLTSLQKVIKTDINQPLPFSQKFQLLQQQNLKIGAHSRARSQNVISSQFQKFENFSKINLPDKFLVPIIIKQKRNQQPILVENQPQNQQPLISLTAPTQRTYPSPETKSQMIITNSKQIRPDTVKTKYQNSSSSYNVPTLLVQSSSSTLLPTPLILNSQSSSRSTNKIPEGLAVMIQSFKPKEAQEWYSKPIELKQNQLIQGKLVDSRNQTRNELQSVRQQNSMNLSTQKTLELNCQIDESEYVEYQRQQQFTNELQTPVVQVRQVFAQNDVQQDPQIESRNFMLNIIESKESKAEQSYQ